VITKVTSAQQAEKVESSHRHHSHRQAKQPSQPVQRKYSIQSSNKEHRANRKHGKAKAKAATPLYSTSRTQKTRTGTEKPTQIIEQTPFPTHIPSVSHMLQTDARFMQAQ
jgi:hypothetical protein